MALQNLRSSTPSKRPDASSMADGQIALNTAAASSGLFFKDASGDLVKVGPVHIGTSAPNSSPATGGSTGHSVGEIWLDTTGSNYELKIYDGTAWREVSVTPGTARQLLQTNVAGTGVEFTSNIDVPGTLDVTGATTLDSTATVSGLLTANGKISFIEGNAAAPGIYPGTDSDTGIYSSSANELGFSTGGVTRLYIKNDGKIGLGTSNPGSLLDIGANANSSLRLTDLNQGSYSEFVYNDNGTSTSALVISADAGNTSTPASNIRFRVDGNEKLRILSDGSVGIGVSAPTEKLDVSGNIKVSGTVDGRDIAADGAKLDGIAANATGDQTASEILTLIKTVDGAGSGLDADKLDGQSSAYYRDAGNLNAGTISDARIPNVITPATRVDTKEIRSSNGTELILNAGESDGKIANQTGEVVYVNAEGGLRVSTPSVANWGSGYVEQRTNIKGTGIYFHHNTTAMGEITVQDSTWLRINQTTNKNIYTPRYIRADGGFFVDGTAKGINGSGNFIGGTIAGASDYGTLLRSNTGDTASGRIVFSSGNNVTAGSTGAQGSIEILQSTVNKDAFMAFHIAGDFATYFGLDGTTNDLFTGGWSDGSTKHKIWHAGNDGSGSGLDADLLDGAQADSSSSASTIVKRTSSQDVNCRLVRSSYANQSTISGGMVFRVNNGADNYLRTCSSTSAIRSFLGVSASGADANYLRANANDTATGTLTFNGLVNIRNGLDFADGDFIRMGSSDDFTFSFNSNNWVYVNMKGNGIIFQDNGTQKFILEDSGILRPDQDNQCAIGTTTRRWNIAYLLNVRSQSQGSPGHNNSTTGYALSSNGSGYFSRSGGEALYCNRNQNGGIVRFGRAGSEKGQIVMNSNSVSYVTTSDYRLKENVVPLENGIQRLLQLQPKRFNFIGDTDEVLDGFLAHEAQAVVPEATSGTKDEVKGIGTLREYDGTVLETGVNLPEDLTWQEEVTDEDGNTTTHTRTRTWVETGTEPVYQGIDQAKLVPLLTAALQEAVARIEALEARVTTLEAS